MLTLAVEIVARGSRPALCGSSARSRVGFVVVVSTQTSRHRQVVVSSQRCLSSQRRKTGNAFKGAYGLRFSVSPEQALQKFERWSRIEQGLNSFLLNWKNVRIAAAYCPVWSFDLNARYVITDSAGRKRLDWKPDIFAAYGSQTPIYIEGLSSYSGYTYRRSLINPLCSTTLVFLGNQVVPFGPWMLRDMLLSNGEHLQVFPDPWNATEGRAFAIVKDELAGLQGSTVFSEKGEPLKVSVQTEIVASRRVYIPTYVIEYKVLGMQFQAFVSGCDEGAEVSGISHKVFDVSNQDLGQASSILVSAAASAQRFLVTRQLWTLIAVTLQLFGSLAARLLTRLPLIGALGGAFVGFRKIVRPWMDNRAASAEWERQREHDAKQEVGHMDDFVDSGRARRFFHSNRERILRSLSGDHEHDQGDYNWYSDWQKWARQQWERQQRQERQQQQTYQQQQQQQQQQQRQTRQTRTKKKQEFQWDFDPSDPYSVLGIRRGASKAEVSAAFRKQMMLHHPDMHSNGSEAEKARAVERSKLITNAYRTIKAQMKR